MFNKLRGKDNFMIDINEKVNVPLIAGVIAVIVVVCFVLFSNQFFPDNSSNTTSNVNTEVMFTYNKIRSNEKFYIDYEKGLGQITIHEIKSNPDKKYKLSFTAYSDNGYLLDVNAIYGNKQSEDEDVMVERDIMLQFAVPEDFKYIVIEIEQKDNTTQSITLDYRDFKEVVLKEQGKDYLKNVENAQTSLSEYKESLKENKASIKALEDEKEEIDKLSEKDKKAKEKRLDEIEKVLETLEVTRKSLEYDIEEMDKTIEQMGVYL